MRQLNRIKNSIGRTKENSKVVVRADLAKMLVRCLVWCTNSSQPDLETLFRIAELLKVDVRIDLY